jgi:hypothetical protein
MTRGSSFEAARPPHADTYVAVLRPLQVFDFCSFVANVKSASNFQALR